MRTIIEHASARRIAAVAISALMLGGCTGLLKEAPSATFDLTAPHTFSGRATSGRGVLVVEEPTAIQTIDSNRMVARSGGQVTYVPNAQWSDRLPSLVQTRIVQAFENSGRISSVGRAQDGLAGDYQLVTDIRSFEVAVSGGSTKAVIEIAAKIVDRAGRVRSGRIFQAEAPAGQVSGPSASSALDRALSQILVDLVGWTSGLV